jgi:tripeptide aminopeptidase
VDGIAEKSQVQFIVRDFDTQQLKVYEDFLREQMEATLRQFPEHGAK